MPTTVELLGQMNPAILKRLVDNISDETVDNYDYGLEPMENLAKLSNHQMMGLFLKAVEVPTRLSDLILVAHHEIQKVHDAQI